MQSIFLKDAKRILRKNVRFEEILFVSDIENFSPTNRKEIQNWIKKENKKVVVFLGDILSFLSIESPYAKLTQQPELMAISKAILLSGKEKTNRTDVDRMEKIIVSLISELIEVEHDQEIREFVHFSRKCKKDRIPIIYYSGNHDSMIGEIAQRGLQFNEIKVIEKLMKGVILPKDGELFKLSNELYIFGLNTLHESLDEMKFHELERFTNSLKKIENSEKIVFVSHIPGTAKFRKLGSKDITTFKKKFKFKVHLHGHCKNYHGEYFEENTPTQSVHFPAHL